MLDKLKKKLGKVDKGALGTAIALMFMSWAALPIIYFLLVRKKKAVKEVEKDGPKDKKSFGESESKDE